MNDKNIPPPNINFNRKEFSELTEDSFLEDNFNDYLRESNDRRSKKKKQDREEDDRRLKSKRRSAMAYEELQENARKQAELNKKTAQDEQMDLEEGELLEFEQELEKQDQALKKQSKEAQQQSEEEGVLEPKQQGKLDEKQLRQKQPKESKQAESKEAHSQVQKPKAQAEETQVKAADTQQEGAEENEEVKSNIEGDPLKKGKKEAKEEVKKEHLTKLGKEEKDTEKLSDKKPLDEGKKKEKKTENESKSEAHSKPEAGAEGKKMNVDPALAQLVKAEAELEKAAQLAQTSQAKSTEVKSEQLKEFEEMAMQIISEAKVLEDGDVIETTVQINSKNPQFDKGEVTVTAYKYRPLEVNLKFTNFDPHAIKLMQKNKRDLKKGLQTKSLKVHQLDIIE